MKNKYEIQLEYRTQWINELREAGEVVPSDKEMLRNNQELLALLRRQESYMIKMRETLAKKDAVIASHFQKDITLKLMNIKVEEMNGFFTAIVARMQKQHAHGTPS